MVSCVISFFFLSFLVYRVLNGTFSWKSFIRWDYVQKHKVQLPDEYDYIYHSLEPFWGVHPRDLNHIFQNWENNSDTKLLSFGKEKEGESFRIFRNDAPDDKRDEFDESVRLRLELLKEVEEWVPPFKALISGWDNPNLLTDWELKANALDAAASKTCKWS